MTTESPTFNVLLRSEEVTSFDAGATIFSEGDPGDCLYAVQEGEVDLIVAGSVVETVSPGGIFGEMALIENEPRSATAIASTPSKLVVVDERRFNFLTQNTPKFALNVLRVVARRLREMDRR